MIAQFAAPPLMQLVCTPLHLLALNMYNDPEATAKERATTVARLFASSVYVRMFRFFCAYGIVRIQSLSPTHLLPASLPLCTFLRCAESHGYGDCREAMSTLF